MLKINLAPLPYQHNCLIVQSGLSVTINGIKHAPQQMMWSKLKYTHVYMYMYIHHPVHVVCPPPVGREQDVSEYATCMLASFCISHYHVYIIIITSRMLSIMGRA